MKILDDSHAYFAASLNGDAKASDHRQVLTFAGLGYWSGLQPALDNDRPLYQSIRLWFFPRRNPQRMRKLLTEA